ncbi:hypothetical protein WKK05_41330 (plasmid) [Nostoc sp. UHCC 0302]|uniref:hypothetical protein n=1 Tax=Nostoc sp. UHCC 0302 TaxID=3134896 RepID=UPI00311CDFB5
MPRKPKAVPLSKVEDIQASLKQKAATPKTISLSDLVKSLAKPIQDMLDAGYDYEDISEVFKGHGVELAASGLKGFHKRASTSTDKSSSNSSVVESAVNDDSEPSSTSEPTATNDSVTPPVEPDSSSADSSESTEPSPSTTTKRKKPTAKAASQFNITDRSEL